MSTIAVNRRGMVGAATQAAASVFTRIGMKYHRWACRQAPVYKSPTISELAQIESDLKALGVPVLDYAPSKSSFREFLAADAFPADYHGGRDGGVWDEKMAEHWISSQLLALDTYSAGDIYVDIAACTSPWVRIQRERHGRRAFAIDLELPSAYGGLSYYRVENATGTCFPDESVRGASLHCAFEMFAGEDDTKLIPELARILVPGGKAVILPLYMHTHYCAYATPEYFGKGFADPGATEYVRRDCSGVRTSRKYNAEALVQRVLNPVVSHGMSYRLLALRNAADIGRDVYCHFILEIIK